MMKKIGVLIVDDSAVVRTGFASTTGYRPRNRGARYRQPIPILAMERMKLRWPDVIVLDVEMPRMDGVTFLKKIMSERPTPVVICSTLTEKGAQTTVEALAAGAVAIVTKPKLGLKQFLQDSSDDLVSAVKTAARCSMSKLKPNPAAALQVEQKADRRRDAGATERRRDDRHNRTNCCHRNFDWRHPGTRTRADRFASE